MHHQAEVIRAGAVRDALERFRALVERRFGDRLRELVLFGSHARGDAHEESDVDVLVVIDGLTEAEKVAIFDLAYDVDRAEPEWLGINPLAFSTDQAADMRGRERALFIDIDREGIRL